MFWTSRPEATSSCLPSRLCLHSNLGHPGPRALSRAIRLSGGSDEAVSAALSYKCPSCAWLREPKPVNPAGLNDRWRDFGDLVCVDLFNLVDFRGNNQIFLNAVDKASGYVSARLGHLYCYTDIATPTPSARCSSLLQESAFRQGKCYVTLRVRGATLL